MGTVVSDGRPEAQQNSQRRSDWRVARDQRELETGPGDIRFLELALKALAATRTLYGIGIQEPSKQTGFTGPVGYTTR